MNKLIVLLAVISVALICVGCIEDYEPSEKIVTDKSYKAAYTEHHMIYNGATMIPTQTYHSERWVLSFNDNSYRTVSEQLWTDTEIGDHIII